MADKNKFEDTTTRTATGFWSIVDEIKDDLVTWVRRIAPFGMGAIGVIPLVFTAEGRALIDEMCHYIKLKFGEQAYAHAYKWTMRGYNLIKSSVVYGLGLILGLGLFALLRIPDLTKVGLRLPQMFWNLFALSLVVILGFARLAPIVAAIGMATGALSSVEKKKSLNLLKSPVAFLLSGGKTGIDWLDGWWHQMARIALFYSIGAVWLTLSPFHNIPYMKYLAGLLIPVLFWVHQAYKPGPERRQFWYFVNWSVAIMVGTITYLLIYPEFLQKVMPIDPAAMASRETWIYRIVAGLILLGLIRWAIVLANKAVSKQTGTVGATDSSGYLFPSQRESNRSRSLPSFVKVALVLVSVVLAVLVMKYVNDPGTSLMIPYHWIMGHK